MFPFTFIISFLIFPQRFTLTNIFIYSITLPLRKSGGEHWRDCAVLSLIHSITHSLTYSPLRSRSSRGGRWRNPGRKWGSALRKTTSRTLPPTCPAAPRSCWARWWCPAAAVARLPLSLPSYSPISVTPRHEREEGSRGVNKRGRSNLHINKGRSLLVRLSTHFLSISERNMKKENVARKGKELRNPYIVVNSLRNVEGRGGWFV